MVPTGFVPDEDQGWFMITVQAPQGASVEYTSNAVREVEAIASKDKDIIGAFSAIGFSFTGNGPNKAMVFLTLKNINKRPGAQHSAAAILNRLRGPLIGLTDVQAFPFLPPAIAGVSSFGGFTFEVQDEGGNTVQQLYNVTQKLVRDGNSRHGPGRTFQPVHRQRSAICGQHRPRQGAQPAGAHPADHATRCRFTWARPTSTISTSTIAPIACTCRPTSPSAAQPHDIRNLYVRSDTGAMIPLDNVVNITESTSPQVITHYNLFRSAEIDGAAGPGYSSGQAIQAMEAGGEEGPAAGLQLLVVRPFAGGDSVGQPVGYCCLRLGCCWSISRCRRNTRASCCPSSSCSACLWRCWAR